MRNNGVPPARVDPEAWTLTLNGRVERPLRLSIAELRSRFEVTTQALLIECGGNGRAFFDPPVEGSQWTYGAVACSEWTGVRLRDLLREAGVKDDAVYTAHVGADTHPSGEPCELPISRGIPLSKARTDDVLVAFGMNGGPIHPHNGAPLRLVVPGWPGSRSQKWLTPISLREIVHDGPNMTGTSYRVAKRPVAPGESLPQGDFAIIERMPVKSLITHPASGARTRERSAEVRGHAWSGDRWVARVEVSIDFGASWPAAELDDPVNPGAWQNWRARFALPSAGYYENWARATDDQGQSQPHALAWNPRGHLNNSLHRVALRAI